MPYQFHKHYTLDEARTLLPQLREWLKQLRELHKHLLRQDEQIGKLLNQGNDAGGPLVNHWVQTVCETRKVLKEFARRQIQIKDVERGLLDFPTLRGGREVFLCWEQDEDDIEFWHELDAGYAGRERL